MLLSTGRQFNSTNGARFTVIGVFDTPEAARRAQTWLTAVLDEIKEWYELPENEAAADEWLGGDLLPPSPPEARLARELRVDWGEYSLDWLDYRGGPVFAVDRLLIVNGANSWIGAKPADGLVERFGGTAYVDGALASQTGEPPQTATLHLDLACAAPDEATARAIQAAVVDYLSRSSNPGGEMFNTPWKSFTRPGWYCTYSTFSGQVHREGRRLRFERGQFFHIADGLPALIAYLEHHGCTDLEYTFTEEVEAWVGELAR